MNHNFYCPFTEEKYGKMVILSCFIFSNISWFTLPKQPVRLVWGISAQFFEKLRLQRVFLYPTVIPNMNKIRQIIND
jgi:hypothetical protein